MNKPKQTIPSKPEKPNPNECCGSGCNPCVFDYYYASLEKWNEEWGHGKDQLNEPDSDTS